MAASLPASLSAFDVSVDVSAAAVDLDQDLRFWETRRAVKCGEAPNLTPLPPLHINSTERQHNYCRASQKDSMAHASFRFATSLAIIFLTSLVGCQSCYYPNGDLAANEQPCSTTGDGPCCPFQWQCLDNGLCYLDYANFFERHTCTDQTWQSPECPNICTQSQHKSFFGDC